MVHMRDRPQHQSTNELLEEQRRLAHEVLDGLAGLRHSTPTGGRKLAPPPGGEAGGEAMPAVRRASASACAALEQMEVALLSQGAGAPTAGVGQSSEAVMQAAQQVCSTMESMESALAAASAGGGAMRQAARGACTAMEGLENSALAAAAAAAGSEAGDPVQELRQDFSDRILAALAGVTDRSRLEQLCSMVEAAATDAGSTGEVSDAALEQMIAEEVYTAPPVPPRPKSRPKP